jgi:asparagine synthase (glutamine-hydrolysing)
LLCKLKSLLFKEKTLLKFKQRVPMCGIFFALFKYSEPKTFDDFYNEIELLTAQSKLLAHRGPDNTVFKFIDRYVQMGFHRLAINGLTTSANQPFQYGELLYCICNGEIYNFKELAEKYQFKLNTGSDCEIILHMYLKFGIDRTIRELDGEFAVCIYDVPKKQVFVARDHIGIRPLFWGLSKDNKKFKHPNNSYIFASEGKALFAIADNVCQFPVGTYATFHLDSDKVDMYQYYSFNYPPTYVINHDMSYKTITENVKNLLINSVHSRMVSDRPIGCFLSGGLDSSLVVSILAKANPNISTFSFGFDKNSSDLVASRKVVEYLGLKNHHELVLPIQTGIETLIDVIRALESYDITTIRASTPQYLLSKYISEKTDIKVLLNGETPDEYFPGYLLFSYIDDIKEFQEECVRMLKNLHQYDLLRTDRTTAKFGLETRCPYAKRELIDFVMNVPVEIRQFGKDGRMEKMILRDAFREGGYLPDAILNRRKHAFSDGVSSTEVNWYKSVEEYAKTIISAEKYENRQQLYPHNTPVSYEAFLYRQLFEEIYPGQSQLISKFWMPSIKGKEITDPSATALDKFKE